MKGHIMFKWFPWRFLLRYTAKRHGFLNPFSLIARLQQFGQPSEIAAPLELVRAGAVFHARGLINSQAIQHNLDWIWPYWIECQFDPRDKAFLPRAFSLTHVNLTHRNWTALGEPDSEELPLVDPRGMVTPFYDGWSIDAWIYAPAGKDLIPSRAAAATQTMHFAPYSIITHTENDDIRLQSTAAVYRRANNKECVITYDVQSDRDVRLVIGVRPYNVEGVSFIDSIELSKKRDWLSVNDKARFFFDRPADEVHMSDYKKGDVSEKIKELFVDQKPAADDSKITCKVGMATAALVYYVKKGERTQITLSVPLKEHTGKKTEDIQHTERREQTWSAALSGVAALKIPDRHMQFLYEAAIRTLILHSAGDIYPGPYTYKRFWFRDAAFIVNALMSIGLGARVKPVIEQFPAKQTAFGYFLSQEGEWDANGEALWALERYFSLSGERPSKDIVKAIVKGAQWIVNKRLTQVKDHWHAGLFPAGFSAEHFGPNDHYYWDDFWGVAGLKAAAALLKDTAHDREREHFLQVADEFSVAIEKSLSAAQQRLKTTVIPASPYRRLDGAVIGSLVASYPLQLFEPEDARIRASVDYLAENSLVDGAFFHDLTHSGINAYLTLHMAQAYLRAGDTRFFKLVKATADFASPTGQWPEAIHPITRGGCMGDGQHVWAAAEWVMMLRTMFVREEEGLLLLCQKLPQEWLASVGELSFGPTLTRFGTLSVKLIIKEAITLKWSFIPREGAPVPQIVLPDGSRVKAEPGETEITLRMKDLA
jgi:hypothetical protein